MTTQPSPSRLFVLCAFLVFTTMALAGGAAVNTVAVHGYDLVSYHQNGKPLPGLGTQAVVHDGATYLFISKENKDAFEKNPQKYLPAFGGYCAYGVAVGKKFDGDPNTWEIVNGKLYLNLNKEIQGMWSKDVAGHIQKAEKNWRDIKDKSAADL